MKIEEGVMLAAMCESPFFASCRACCRLVTGIFQTISTCRDAWFETPKHPRDFPVCRRLPRDKSPTRVTGTFRGSRRNGIWA